MPFNENIWEPNKKQAAFLAVPPTVREAFYGGGAGSGKSEVLLMYPIVNGWHKEPSFKQVFMRRTHQELKKEIVPRSKLIYPKFGATFNQTDMLWTFPSGASIFLGHCENEDDVHNYDSMEINLFTPDELTSCTEYIYMYIGFTRVRSSDRSIPAIIRATGMPGDIGHGWVKKRFIDPWPQGGKVIIGKGNNKRIYIHSTLKDNDRYIDPNYAQGLEGLNEAEKRAKLYGDWSTYEGQVFDEFRDRHYPSEPANALHVIDEFIIPAHWPRIMAIDWGYNAMCSIGTAAISPTSKVYVYRHQWWRGKKIEEWAPEVKRFVDLDNINDITICHSANQHRGDPHTIQEQVSDALGVPVHLGVRDRIGGKALVHEYLRWKPKNNVPASEVAVYDDDLAKWIMRNKGLVDYKKYLESFAPQVEEINIPRLQFFNDKDVRMIGNALKACNYEKTMKDGKKKEDVAEFDGDDPYDMLRMLLHAADQFFMNAMSAQERLDKIDKVVNQFESSNDMTSYYRNMRTVESQLSDSIKPIKRFHQGYARTH